MKTLSLAAALLASLALAACGDKPADKSGDKPAGGSGGAGTYSAPSAAPKASGPVGTWELDVNALWESGKEMAMASAKEGFAQMEEGFKAFADLPDDQKEAAKKMALEQTPAAQRPLVEAYFKSPETARAMMEKMVKEQFSTMKATVTVKADGTWTSTSSGMGNDKDESGTWTQSGDTVTVNKKAADGEEAKSYTMTVKGDTMSGKPDAEGPTITLRRK